MRKIALTSAMCVILAAFPRASSAGDPVTDNGKLPSWDHFQPVRPDVKPTEDITRYTIETFVKTEATIAGAAMTCDKKEAEALRMCSAAIIDHWPQLTQMPDVMTVDPTFRVNIEHLWAVVMSATANYQRAKHPFTCEEILNAAQTSAVWSVCNPNGSSQPSDTPQGPGALQLPQPAVPTGPTIHLQ
jgi:hypothetical protein